MTVELNHPAVVFAKRMIRAGHVVRDERDHWSEHAASVDQENRFLKREDWESFARWHLGEDAEQTEHTTGRVEFPIGDYRNVHRCAIIAIEGRAAQHDHEAIAAAAKELLELIDRG